MDVCTACMCRLIGCTAVPCVLTLFLFLHSSVAVFLVPFYISSTPRIPNNFFPPSSINTNISGKCTKDGSGRIGAGRTGAGRSGVGRVGARVQGRPM